MRNFKIATIQMYIIIFNFSYFIKMDLTTLQRSISTFVFEKDSKTRMKLIYTLEIFLAITRPQDQDLYIVKAYESFQSFIKSATL